MKAFRSLIFGLTMPARALRMILAHPPLLALSALPVLITLVLYFYGLASLENWIDGWMTAGLTARGLDPASFAFTLAHWTLRILLIVGAALTFSIAASIVASPFNDWLSERTERYTDLARPPRIGWTGKARLLMIDAAKSIAALAGTLLALLLSWIPVVNVLAVVLALLLLTFQYVSYPQTRRGETLGTSLAFLGRHFWACLGWGTSMTLLFMIPFVSAFMLPIAVVGGTLLYARETGSNPE